MTVTPWGNSLDQRERLLAAMVATVAERGYAATRVTDVTERAAVTRDVFHEHFADRLDCFLATLTALLELTDAQLAGSLAGDDPWDERLREGFRRFVDLVVEHPAEARLCLVEAYAAGPRAAALVDRAARGAGRRALAVLEESPERANMPAGVARAVLGGLRKVVQKRVYDGRQSELPELAPQLIEWALSYRTPPSDLLQPAEPDTPPRPEPRDQESPRQRILDALTESVARDGYAATTVTAIGERSATSLSTFYSCFEDKETAFIAALDDAVLRMLEVALPAYRAADDWPHGVHTGIAAIVTYLSLDPVTARFTAQVVWTGSPRALRHLDEAMGAFGTLLAEGLRPRLESASVVGEAVGSSILALLYEDAVRNDPALLYRAGPSASYVALAPALGAIEACAVVNGR